MILRGWNQKAMAGQFENIEFATRDPGSTALSPQTRQALAKMDQKIAALAQSQHNIRRPLGSRRSDYKKIKELRQQRDLLEKVGYGAYKTHHERICDGIPYNNIGQFPTHHQKTLLIDHGLPDEVIGFVQGFNFWPKYFDDCHHPYRGDNNRIQDVGLMLKGSCLIDIYHNFAQSWNRESDTPIPETPPKIVSRGKGGYTCQILRTWRDQDEFKILEFYENALSKLNQFIYVEDQYFRQPEFARAIKKRAEQIRKGVGNKKQLHVFATTNLNEIAIGGIDVRADMLNELNRKDANASEADFKAVQADEEARQQIKAQMEKSGVMVHICRLRNSQVSRASRPSGHRGQYRKVVHYGDIYVHSKLTLFDNAYLTLGSPNWNHRSMTTDTELNIAVQCHDDKAEAFRTKIWNAHTNGLWKEKIPNGTKTKPKDWYKQWDEILRENFFAYAKGEPLIMNLFPYYEDIQDVIKRAGWIGRMKQKST